MALGCRALPEARCTDAERCASGRGGFGQGQDEEDCLCRGAGAAGEAEGGAPRPAQVRLQGRLLGQETQPLACAAVDGLHREPLDLHALPLQTRKGWLITRIQSCSNCCVALSNLQHNRRTGVIPPRFPKVFHLQSRSELRIRQRLSSVTALQTKSIGYWGDEEKAAREYDRAALEMRGPSAELNFPGEALPAGPKKPRKVATKEFVQLPMVSGEAVSLAVSAIVEAWKAGKPHPRMQPAQREHIWQRSTSKFPVGAACPLFQA